MAQVTEQPQGVLLLLSSKDVAIIDYALAVAHESTKQQSVKTDLEHVSAKIAEQQILGGNYEG